MLNWSKPYHGVTHSTVNGQQVTVSEYPSFVEAVVFPRTGTPNFFERAETALFSGASALADAKAWCEKTAKAS